MGELLCTLVEPSSCGHPIAVTISNEGYILATYADKKGVLALFSVNGKHLASSTLEEQILVSILVFITSCYRFFILCLVLIRKKLIARHFGLLGMRKEVRCGVVQVIIVTVSGENDFETRFGLLYQISK